MTKDVERGERLLEMLQKTKSTLEAMRALQSMVDERSDKNLSLSTQTTLREVFGVFLAMLAVMEDYKDIVGNMRGASKLIAEFVHEPGKLEELDMEVLELLNELADFLVPD